MCAGKLLPKRAHKNAILCSSKPSATEAGAHNDIMRSYKPSGLSVAIKFDDRARHLNVRAQTATEAGAQKCHFCHNAPSATEAGAQNVILCRYTRPGHSVTIKYDEMVKLLNVRGQSLTEAGEQKCHFLQKILHQLPKRGHKITYFAVIRFLALMYL